MLAPGIIAGKGSVFKKMSHRNNMVAGFGVKNDGHLRGKDIWQVVKYLPGESPVLIRGMYLKVAQPRKCQTILNICAKCSKSVVP